MPPMWTARHEALVSPEGVGPHGCDPLVVPHGQAVLERGNPWASAGDTCRDATTQVHWAARAVESGGVSVPQARDGSSRARRMPAYRVARCNPDGTRNALPPKT
jgi:hypothetical protein